MGVSKVGEFIFVQEADGLSGIPMHLRNVGSGQFAVLVENSLC